MSKNLIPEPLLERVARRFKALSEPIRLQLVNMLQVHGEMSVMDLVETTGHKQANVSKHLGVLHQEGLLKRRKAGTRVYYSIQDPGLGEICSLICQRLIEEAEETRRRMIG